MALYSCTAVPSLGLRRIFLVGPEGNFAGRFFLGRLARADANLWILSHLRCENGYVRRTHSPPRFRDVSNLVCHRGRPFAISAERYARYLLHVWRTVHPAISRPTRSTADAFRSHRSFGCFSAPFLSVVDHRKATQPREARFAGNQHCLLVVLQ